MATHAFEFASSSASALPTTQQQRLSHRPPLQSLPVSRDSLGRSPFLLSLQSPRPFGSPASPKPVSSPAAQLLESLTPRLTRQPSQSSRPSGVRAEAQEKREDLVLHLETCLQISEAVSPLAEGMRKEVLREWTSRDEKAGKLSVGYGSIMACEGTPTARAVCREFPDAIAAKYSEGEAALAALEGRKAHKALLPVESSMQGTVHRTYDLLLRYNVHIVGELIESCCSANEEEEDTHHRRFWVVARDACMLPREAASFKTAVALVLREGLGALHKVVSAFAFRDIPITKLESRPWRAEPLCPPTAAHRADADAGTYKTYFQYVLFIEFQSSTASRAAQNALAQLQELSSFLRLLGSYPSFHTTSSALTPAHCVPHIGPHCAESMLVRSSYLTTTS